MYNPNKHINGMPISHPPVKEGLEFLYVDRPTTFNPSYAGSTPEDELDFLGICLGGKGCKERKKARQDRREIRRDARTARVVARTQNVVEGGTTGNFLEGAAGALSGLFGGKQGDQSQSADMYQEPQPEVKSLTAGTNKVMMVVVVLLILGAVFYKPITEAAKKK